MSVYCLDDIVAECIREHARVQTVARGLTKDSKDSIYKESMHAMNSWIESRLCKRKVSREYTSFLNAPSRPVR